MSLLIADLLVREQQLRERGDARQRIIQLMRDAAHELADRGHLLGLNQLLLQLLLGGRVADHADHFAAALGAGVVDGEMPTLAVLVQHGGLELPRLARQCATKFEQRTRQRLDREQRAEKLADQLLVRVARDLFGCAVHGRESSERVEGHDGVAGRLEEMPIPRLRSRELRAGLAFGRHVAGADHEPSVAVGRAHGRHRGHGDRDRRRLAAAELDARVKALRPEQSRVTSVVVERLAIAAHDERAQRRANQLVAWLNEQLCRRGVAPHDATVHAGRDQGVGRLIENVGEILRRVYDLRRVRCAPRPKEIQHVVLRYRSMGNA